MAENLDKNGIFPQSNIFVEEIDVQEIEHVEVFHKIYKYFLLFFICKVFLTIFFLMTNSFH